MRLYLLRLWAALWGAPIWEDHEKAWDSGWEQAQHAYKQAHRGISESTKEK